MQMPRSGIKQRYKPQATPNSFTGLIIIISRRGKLQAPARALVPFPDSLSGQPSTKLAPLQSSTGKASSLLEQRGNRPALLQGSTAC